MDIKEFVAELPYSSFNELRKAVLDRHSREAAEIFKVVQLLRDTPDVEQKMQNTPPHEFIADLINQTGYTPELCIRALERFMVLVSQGNGQEETSGKPKT